MRRSMIALSSTCLLAVVLSGGATPATYAADESVTVVARLYASPGREAELEARILKTVEFVRKAEPNIAYRAHRSKKDPSLILFYEVYPSQAAFAGRRTLCSTARNRILPCCSRLRLPGLYPYGA